MWFNILALLAKRFCVDVDVGRIVSIIPGFTGNGGRLVREKYEISKQIKCHFKPISVCCYTILVEFVFECEVTIIFSRNFRLKDRISSDVFLHSVGQKAFDREISFGL